MKRSNFDNLVANFDEFDKFKVWTHMNTVIIEFHSNEFIEYYSINPRTNLLHRFVVGDGIRNDDVDELLTDAQHNYLLLKCM